MAKEQAQPQAGAISIIAVGTKIIGDCETDGTLRIEGLDQLMAAYADRVCVVDLLPIGAHRRDWRATLLSDGMVIVRHPDLDGLLEVADRFGTDLRLYAS